MSNPRIMIVDDQRTVRSLLKQIIESIGATVVGESEDGEAAVAQYQVLKPDMVLMDINMPKMDGIEALRKIMVLDPNAIVIMLTSQNTSEAVQDCILSGAKNFLLKANPRDKLIEELKSTWKKYLPKHDAPH